MKPRNFRRASIKSIANLLDREPTAMPVLAHASEVLNAGRIYQRIISPALGRVSCVANMRAGVIIIHAEHGAAANKLKQQTQGLIDAFLEKGVECSGIEIRVQAMPRQEKERFATQKPISEQALTSIAQAAATMRPGSVLKEKLEYLIQHAARQKPD